MSAPPSHPPRSDDFPPRGLGLSDEALPAATWLHPDELIGTWTYTRDEQDRGAVILGEWRGERLGRRDDRHVVTIAGSRAGKSQTVLIPNLRRYPGPVVVVDPKGELYEATADHRRAKGHDVFLLNPFNVGGLGSHGHNPIQELRRSVTMSADAAQLADALIIAPERGDTHWTDAAKNLVGGVMMHMMARNPDAASLPMLRRLICEEDGLGSLFEAMAANEAYGGAVQNVGASMLGKTEKHANGSRSISRELSSIISTATEQTRPLDDITAAIGRHDFDLRALKGPKPVSIYLVLPATRIATHHRWLRLFIYQVLAELERERIDAGRLPLWLVLEEFAALGTLQPVEAAAGYMAGMGVKLWAVLQDLNQLKRHYPHSWETFLGNAGIIQAFGNVDMTTTRYLSDLLGQTVVGEEQRSFVSAGQRSVGADGTQIVPRSAPLLAPSEIALHFARDTHRQLVMIPGTPPTYFNRLPFEA